MPAVKQAGGCRGFSLGLLLSFFWPLGLLPPVSRDFRGLVWVVFTQASQFGVFLQEGGHAFGGLDHFLGCLWDLAMLGSGASLLFMLAAAVGRQPAGGSLRL